MLQLGVEASTLAEMEYLIADEVVTFGTITAAGAGNAVITKPVNNLIT